MIAIASLAAGCSFSSNAAKTDSNLPHDGSGSGSGMIDAAVDAPPDGPTTDFGPAPFTVHLSTLPTAAVTLPGTINTDTDSHCSTSASWVSNTQPDSCFIVGTSITAGGSNTAAVGSRPLVLVSTSTVTLGKGIDVSSKRANTTSGAGGNFNVCGAFTTNPGADSNGGGGGAGGTFLTQGGAGGIGNADPGVPGGVAPTAVTAPTVLRGGCVGQKGGNGNAGNPGNGGGAVYIVAAESITIATGVGINASGAGGTHGGHASGGSGGGSGGMIMLFARTITATGASFAANGGGASSGGDSNANGMDGSDTTAPMTPAVGGIGPGGNGGSGAILTTAGGVGGDGGNNQGGGGGGGGVGYIRSNVTLTGATASPAPDVVP